MAPPELLVVVLSCGMNAADLAAAVRRTRNTVHGRGFSRGAFIWMLTEAPRCRHLTLTLLHSPYLALAPSIQYTTQMTAVKAKL
jgi:hypothetical protein